MDYSRSLRHSLDNLDSTVVAHNQKLLAAVLNTLRGSKEVNECRLDLDGVRKSQIVGLLVIYSLIWVSNKIYSF